MAEVAAPYTVGAEPSAADWAEAAARLQEAADALTAFLALRPALHPAMRRAIDTAAPLRGKRGICHVTLDAVMTRDTLRLSAIEAELQHERIVIGEAQPC